MSFPNKNTNHNKSGGFTVIELLIVLAIIVLVYGVIFINFDVLEYIRQSRDSRRVNDLLVLQNSLTLATINTDIKFTNTLGCTNCTSALSSQSTNGEGWVQFEKLSEQGLTKYIPTLPLDPTNEGIFFYSYYSNGIDFELNAILESEKYADLMKKDGGNDDDIYERGLIFTLK